MPQCERPTPLRERKGRTPIEPNHGPLRICFFIDELSRAGTESQLVALINGMDRSRFKPHLILLKGESRVSRALEPKECPIVRLNLTSLKKPQTIWQIWTAVTFLKDNAIDILQVYFLESTYIGILSGLLARVPRIVRTRNNIGYWMTPFHQMLGRICNRFTDGIIANCDASKKAIMKDEKVHKQEVVVLENGVDIPTSQDETPHVVSCNSNHKVNCGISKIGVVANLRPVKGVDVFLKAACHIAKKHPNVRFHIAGDGEIRKSLENLAGQLGIADKVVFEGSILNVASFLASTTIAVLPSHSEGMSNALLEYMAAGKPIVATEVGGNGTLIEDGKHGLLTPPGDPISLADAVMRLLDDPDLARRLGLAARRRVEERYSRSAMIRRFELYYESLAGGSRRAA